MSPSAKVLGQRQRVGDAAFAFLIGVIQMLQSEFLAVRQQPQKIAGVPPARHQQNVANPRVDQRLERVIDHGLVVNRKQVFVGDLGQREQTASAPSGQYDAFHVNSYLTRGSPQPCDVFAVTAAPWISCRLHTRTGSRRRETIASTEARAPLMVVMHGMR